MWVLQQPKSWSLLIPSRMSQIYCLLCVFQFRFLKISLQKLNTIECKRNTISVIHYSSNREYSSIRYYDYLSQIVKYHMLHQFDSWLLSLLPDISFCNKVVVPGELLLLPLMLELSGGINPSFILFFCFILLFWNHIFTWVSFNCNADAISILLALVRYLLKWNSFSSSVSCLLVKFVRPVLRQLSPSMLEALDPRQELLEAGFDESIKEEATDDIGKSAMFADGTFGTEIERRHQI